MPFFDSIRLGSSSSADAAFSVDRSLRFNGDDTYLNKTPSTLGDRKKWTWSAWVKRSKLGTVQDLFSAYHESGFYNVIRFGSDDQLNFQSNSAAIKETNRVFRDPSAWYHIVVSVDTLNTTAADRVIIYVNGSRETLATDNTVNFGIDYAMNSAQPHTIGVYADGSSYNFDGYMAEINFIDGQALTPSSFGETNSTTGQWNPKEYEGTYSKSGSASDGTTWVSGSSNNNNQVEANAFNGINVTGAADAGSMYQTALNGSYTVTPSTSFTVNSKLSFQMYANVANFNTYSSIYVNGSEVTMTFVTGTNGSTNDGLFESNFTGTVNNFGLASHPTSINGIAQVVVDGDVLINGFNNNGKNSFYLKFSENSGTTATTLGKDSSGQSNNYTPNNFSVSAGAGNDSVVDTPTNNFCTLNPLDKNSNVTASDGNLKATGGSGAHYPIFSSFGMKGGKWYAEFRNENSNNWRHAIMNIEHDGGSLNGDSTVANSTSAVNKVGYGLNVSNGNKMHDTDTGSSYGSALSGTSDVLQCAVDLDNGKIYWGINNTWFNSGDPAAGSNPAFSGIDTTITWTFAFHIYSSNGCTVNFGQQGFSYTPPTGFKALSSANLPDPTIKLPNKHFGTLLFTGNGGTQSITDSNAVDFTPDWVWIKTRSTSNWHFFFDAVRGVGRFLFSNSTSLENGGGANPETSLTSFITNGFSLGADPTPSGSTGFNINSATHVAWNWNAGDTDGKTYTVKVVDDSGNKYRFDDFGTSAVTLDLAEGGTYIFDQSDSSNATHPLRFYTAADKSGGEYTTGVTTSGTAGSSGATVTITIAASAPTLYYQCSSHAGMGGQINTNSTLGSSNFDGTIQSTVKANTTAGFSIVSYVGNNATGATVGHGLNNAPQTYIVKDRDTSGYNWHVFHASLGATKELKLNTTAAAATQAFWNNTAPTSSVFTVNGGGWEVNTDTKKHIAYVFSEVAGYSKFGSYIGNASSDGTFVFTGFRVAWLMTKRIDSSSNWAMYDNKRDPHNVIYGSLIPNLSNSESTGSVRVDFVSNGFKHRNSDGGAANNISGAQYIYLAFAESPFKNARAR